jgi:hypothetical protein
MKLINQLVLLVFCYILLSSQVLQAYEAVREQRISALQKHFIKYPISEIAITTHPVKKGKVFSRLFNISLSSKAYLQLKTAPDQDGSSSMMLEKIAQYYIDNPTQIIDPDSAYWAGEYHTLALRLFGYNGSERKGAISRQSELKVLEYMMLYLNYWSRLAHYDYSLTHETYAYWNSENHWWQEIVTAWGYLLILKDDPEFTDKKLADGKSVQQHFDANSNYMRHHMSQRARKGFLLEISSGGYSSRMHNMWLLIHDLSDDPKLKTLARNTLDLWWSFWAEEQISGERGGGKVRHRGMRGLLPNTETHMSTAWIYFGVGSKNMSYFRKLKPDSTASSLNYATVFSDYRPHPIIYAILQDRDKAPPYAIIQRRLGKSAADSVILPDALNKAGNFHLYDYENSEVLKYSWVSRNFVLGTNMRPPLNVSAWEAGSAQSWWHGLLIKGHDDTYPERVVPTLIYERDSMGAHYAVQSKGSFMTRKLSDVWSQSRDNRKLPMGIYISSGLTDGIAAFEKVIFINNPTTWVAIRAADSSFKLFNETLPKKFQSTGLFFQLLDDTNPLIIEVAEKDKFDSFNDFKNAVVQATLSYQDGKYNYNALSGDKITLFDDRSSPMINDKPINYNVENAYHSRYVKSKWDSEVVTILVAEEILKLDFSIR